jgi:hypothetical protein
MDLVIVGMRFQSAYKRGMVKTGDFLLLEKEPSNTANKNAVAVFQQYTHNGSSGSKIGYIRDADLDKLHREIFSKLSHNGYLSNSKVKFSVTKVSENYICIAYADDLRGILVSKEDQVRKELEALKAAKEAALASLQGTPSVTTLSGVASLSANGYITGNTLFSTGAASTTASLATTNSINTLKKETNTMNFNTNSIKDSFFREVKNVAFDITSGKLGVTSKDGISVYTKDGVSVNPITDMGVALPAFAMRVPVADLKEGDILIGNGDPVFFKEFYVDSKDHTTGYKTVSLNGAIQEVGVVTNMFFGKNTVLAVKNMFGESASGSIDPMMMLAMSGMLGDDSNSKIDPMMLMLMSGGMGGGNAGGGMNPMMLALMMSKK